jgi:putative hydrolase of the HAD superfamily
MKAEIATVIFDCGQVITHAQNKKIARTMADLIDIPWEEFPKAYLSVRGEYDRGSLDAQTYWSMVAAPFGKKIDQDLAARLAVLDMDSWFSINIEVVDIIIRLKQEGYRLLMLSNMNWEGKKRMFGSARVAQERDWIAAFDEILLSCDLGLVKPEPEIYSVCLEKARAEPGRCLFIDDMPGNIVAAQAAGMKTILFREGMPLGTMLMEAYGLF